MKYISLNLQLRIGRWSIQFGNEYEDLRVILWKHREATGRSGSFARWQWNFRSWPTTWDESEVPVITLVGVRVVPMEEIVDDHVLDAAEVDG